jgi:hypothetical protein
MFTLPSRHDELLYWSCSRIALGIRRRRRRSQTEKARLLAPPPLGGA